MYKDGGHCAMEHFKEGVDGWVTWLLTRSEQDVMVYLAKLRRELDQGYYIYQYSRRVWAQTSYDGENKRVKTIVQVENIA